MYVAADLVLETTTTTGTGTLTLAGAVSNYLTFAAEVGEGNTCSYTIQASDGQLETGVGTVVGSTLERTTLISSSTGSKLNLPTGTHQVGGTANSFSLTPGPIGAATAAQGALADTAMQPLASANGPNSSATLAVNTRYLVDMSAWAETYTYTLPATFAVNDRIEILVIAGRTSSLAWLQIVPAVGDTIDPYNLVLVGTADAFGVTGSTANSLWKVSKLQYATGISIDPGNLLILGSEWLPYISADELTPAVLGAAPAASGVTNGDSHDHSGGDGAQIAYSSLSGTPTIPDPWDGDIADINLDGGTDIGADLVDADLILVDDGAGGTNRKSALSRVWTYITAKITAGISPLLLSYKETVYAITDGAGFAIDPANGSIQTITLGASRSPTATNFAAGHAITLMVNDGSAYTITWPSVTWVGGSAPTLATSGYTVINLWKVGSTLYGMSSGSVA